MTQVVLDYIFTSSSSKPDLTIIYNGILMYLRIVSTFRGRTETLPYLFEVKNGDLVFA